MKQKKNVLLADCVAQEVMPLAKELMYDSQPFEVKVHISNWKRTGKISELKRYAVYFMVGFRYFLSRKKYACVIGWQQFYALIFCFFCSLFSVKKTAVTVALNFTYKEKKGKLAGVYRWFMSKCLSEKYMDYLHVLSESYADQIARDFGFPRERIIVTTFGIVDRGEELGQLLPPEGQQKDGFALAIGRSNRDYDFLIEAWKEIDYPLVIISDTYGKETSASNITILKNVAGEESYPWIANCSLMVIPIDDGSICSGDTVLLTAMSVKRRILVTKPSTLAEMYIQDGQNAVLVEKNISIFRDTVNKLLRDEASVQLGEQARTSFLNSFTIDSMGRRITDILQNESVAA